MTKDAGPAIGSTESPATGQRSGRASGSGRVVDDSPVEAIGRLRPDVVLLDLRMPDLDGFGVLERMREASLPSTSRVLIVSASLDEETERAAHAAGAAGCVSKDSPRIEICAAALRIARE